MSYRAYNKSSTSQKLTVRMTLFAVSKEAPSLLSAAYPNMDLYLNEYMYFPSNQMKTERCTTNTYIHIYEWVNEVRARYKQTKHFEFSI